MIIECINCNKKFNVKSELIPPTGRTIQCGSCNHTWFFKLPQVTKKLDDTSNNKNFFTKKEKNDDGQNKNLTKKIDKIINTKDTALVKYEKKSQFTLSKFLSYIIVVIISFIGLILLLDTFKFQLFDIIPSLELLLFNLFETLKDVQLFIKDLI
tara:strand:+ start:49 stop:510 length:462 start_codon:yes stop_codon:yes gene_type:complete